MASRGISTNTRDFEREFSIDELFFSTTDLHGVILHGNEVFTRISGFKESELIGAPHSVVRHPDMPRAIFGLLWGTIQDGKTIAAYVKNLAKDGCYYWVLALAMPCNTGYLSIRLKPTSPLLHTVKSLYGEMLRLERSIEVEPKFRKAGIAASTELLLKRLKELGFRSYEEFMMQALSAELTARHEGVDSTGITTSGHSQALHQSTGLYKQCRSLDSQLQTAYERIGEFRSTSVTLMQKSSTILSMAESIRVLSMHATISAGKLGNDGATLQVVSDSLRTVSDDSQDVTRRLLTRMDSVVEILDRLIFNLAATKLQSEISLQFVGEVLASNQALANSRMEQSLRTLFEEMKSRVDQVFSHLAEAEREMADLRSQVTLLDRNNRVLRFVQFAGEKESISCTEAQASRDIFLKIREQIAKTRAECEYLSTSLQKISTEVHDLLTLRASIVPHLEEIEAFDVQQLTTSAVCV